MVLPPYNTAYVQQVILCLSDSDALRWRNPIKTDMQIMETASCWLIGCAKIIATWTEKPQQASIANMQVIIWYDFLSLTADMTTLL